MSKLQMYSYIRRHEEKAKILQRKSKNCFKAIVEMSSHDTNITMAGLYRVIIITGLHILHSAESKRKNDQEEMKYSAS